MGKRLTVEDFKNRVQELVGAEYTFLEDYKGRHEKIKCRHNSSCNHEWYVEAGAFLGNKNKKGSRCPECYGNVKKTTTKFKKEVEELTDGEYELTSEYVNAHTDVKIKHNKCNEILTMTPNTFLSGNRCSYCAINKPYTTKTANERIIEKTNGAFELVGEYENCFAYMSTRHKKCGNITKVTMQHLSSRTIICSHCNPNSKGERFIANFLESKGIRYVAQFRAKGLKKYPFDFYIPETNTLIEYQGVQHYEPREFFGGIEAFNNRKYIDKIKKGFALENGYTFVEISYYVDTQETVNEVMTSLFK